MSSPFVAEITMFGFNFAPRGWAFCHGQLLPISQNTALFSLLGTMYGGDGKSTFALPDLQDQTAVVQLLANGRAFLEVTAYHAAFEQLDGVQRFEAGGGPMAGVGAGTDARVALLHD